jgi:hypothetical protein
MMSDNPYPYFAPILVSEEVNARILCILMQNYRLFLEKNGIWMQNYGSSIQHISWL